MSNSLFANLQKIGKALIKQKKPEREDVSAKVDTESTKQSSTKQSPIPQDWVMPVVGKVLPLAEIPDSVFSSGVMGAGFAIEPESGQVVSPVAGKVSVLFPTKHAIVIEAENGLEVLIHIGIDTVKLQGEGFTALVDVEDKVEAGTPLMAVDWEIIGKKAPSIITPIIFTGLTDKEHIDIQSGKPVIVISD